MRWQVSEGIGAAGFSCLVVSYFPSSSYAKYYSTKRKSAKNASDSSFKLVSYSPIFASNFWIVVALVILSRYPRMLSPVQLLYYYPKIRCKDRRIWNKFEWWIRSIFCALSFGRIIFCITTWRKVRNHYNCKQDNPDPREVETSSLTPHCSEVVAYLHKFLSWATTDRPNESAHTQVETAIRLPPLLGPIQEKRFH